MVNRYAAHSGCHQPGAEGEEYTYNAILPDHPDRQLHRNRARRPTQSPAPTRSSVKPDPSPSLDVQRRKNGLELKQDMELAILANKASVAGSDAAIRKSAGFAAWITTNDSVVLAGPMVGFVGAGIVAACNHGAPSGPLPRRCWMPRSSPPTPSGGSPTVLMVSPYLKTVFSTFINIADGRTAVIQTEHPR